MKLPLLISILCLSISGAGFSHAQEDPAEPTPTPSTGRFLASTQSSFNVDRKARNPFHPIGYVPATGQAPAAAVKAPPPQLPDNALRVTSILLGDLRLAVINGREYAEGESVTVNVANQPVEVLVMEIGDGFIVAGVQGRPPQRIAISR